jgi:cytoskeletal protein CcmA (bactofilin family)
MFNRNKTAAPQKRIDSLIGAGTVVRGDVVFCGGLRIDGHVQGNVTTADGEPGTLVVSEQARVDGEVSVSHVVINGSVNGSVRADDFIELHAKARITGDLSYRRLEMQTGAVVQGRLVHAEPVSAPVVELRLAAAE